MQKIPLPILIEDEELIPVYGSAFASGADLRSASKQEIILHPGESALIPTGIRMEIPDGFEVQIRPRSGLALKHQITAHFGTIDADYRGEVKVLLLNHGKEPFKIDYGKRIAQMVVMPVVQADFCVQKTLASSARGEGGFGHTGTH